MKTKQQGIGLLEALIAFLVVGIGIAALIKLEGVFLQSGSESKARTVALNLAQEKLDDLKSFTQLDTDNTLFDYQDIVTNAGGALSGGQLVFPSGQVATTRVPTSNVTYNLSWTVQDGYWAGTTLQYDPQTPPKPMPDQKQVTVNVSWIDQQNVTQSVQIAGIIAQLTPENTDGVADAASGGGSNAGIPEVFYTPQAAPDVIAQPRIASSTSTSSSSSSSTSSTSSTSSSTSSSGGTCQIYTETDKPDPTIENNSGGVADNNMVSFSTTTYEDCGTSPKIEIKKEEFFTLNCSCDFTGSSGTGLGYDQWHVSVTKTRSATKTGQANGQHELCDTCCQDHHENTTGDHVCDYSSEEDRKNCYTPFRYDFANDDDHNHYASSASSTPVSSGTYLESCRLKRVNGYWTVVSDWNLVGFNVFVRSDLNNAANVSSYQDYVAGIVNAYANSGTAATPWTAPTATTPTDGTEMMARGVFVDYMAPSEKAGLNFLAQGLVPQEVPFYEYHVSSLADWKTSLENDSSPHTSTASPCPTSASTNGTCIDSPSVSQVASVNQNQTIEKGAYRVASGADTPSSNIKITAEMKKSNSGVTGTSALGSIDAGIASSSLTVAYTGSSGGPATHSISLSTNPGLTCPSIWGTGGSAKTFSSQNDSSWSSIALSCNPGSDGASSCTSYSSAPSSVEVAVNPANGLQCVYSDGAATPTYSTYSCPSTITETFPDTHDNPDNPAISGTKTCTISMSKSGSSTDCDLVCQ